MTTDNSTFNNTVDYTAIAEDVIAVYDAKDDDSKKNMAACILRLAGHDFMDYRYIDGVASGGSDGCVNFNDADNAGL